MKELNFNSFFFNMIQREAYRIFENNGKNHGHHLKDWLEAEKIVSQWYLERFGIVIGNKGGGGSGVFVKTADGYIALLTAAHVVLPTVLSGHISVGRYADRNEKGHSVEPFKLRVSTESDAALLYLPKNYENPHLLVHEWNPDFNALIEGQQLLSFGLPGAWKEINLETRKFDKATILVLDTQFVLPDSRYPTLDRSIFIEQPNILPKSFAGMSGGPVYDELKNFVGILVVEQRGTSFGYVLSSPRISFKDIYTQFQPTSVLGCWHQAAIAKITVKYTDPSYKHGPLHLSILCDFYWSEIKPNQREANFGRTAHLTILNSKHSSRYPINFNKIFDLPEIHDENSRLKLLLFEMELTLNKMGYEIVNKSAIKIGNSKFL